MSAITGMAKMRSTSPSATMLPSGPRFDTMIRFKQATKIARFLTCSGKSTIPNPNALGGDMESMDSIHLGGDESGSGGASTVLRPSTRSRTPTVTLITRPTVETASSAPPKRVIPEIPITAHVVKYPSMRAAALGRGLWEPRNRIVSRSNGGAIEPPMARTTSPGRRSLIRTRRFRAGARRRRAGYHGIWIPLPTQALVTRAVERSTWWPLHSAVALPFVREGLAQFVLLLLGQVCRDDLEVVLLELVDDLVGRRRPAGQSKQR